jgi:hypothetical protein
MKNRKDQERMMKTYLRFWAILMLSVFSFSTLAQQSFAASESGMYATKAVELKMTMRKLWEDHIAYTRNYIISALAGLPDVDAVAGRLLKNQDDIGDAIKPYYGKEAGDKLAALLRDHIMIATEVVKAAKDSNNEQLTIAQDKWSANGKDIAAFLSGANLHWPQKDLEGMLQVHLDLTTGEVVGRLTQDWAKDIRSYDEGHAHMLMFADMLSEGIARQFPAKFWPEI